MATTRPSDVTAAEWEMFEQLVATTSQRGHPRYRLLRGILNAMFYLVCSDCAWRVLPRDVPPWKTVFILFAQGAWVAPESVHTTLRQTLRVQLGRDSQPSTGIWASSRANRSRGRVLGGIAAYRQARR